MITKLDNLINNEYSEFLESFTDLSYDTENEISFVTFDENALNYDKLIKESLNSNCNIINFMTPDALILNKQEIIFIEFKNSKTKYGKGECNKIKNKNLSYNIRLKAIEGIFALAKLLQLKGIISKFNDIFKYTFKYILVYSGEKNKNLLNTENNINNLHRSRNKSLKIIFGLERYKDIIYKDILTISDQYFIKNYGSIIS